jgi:hypothetical protein
MVLEEEEGAHAHAWCACACTYVSGEGGGGYGCRHSPAAQNKNLRIAHGYFSLPSRIRGGFRGGLICLAPQKMSIPPALSPLTTTLCHTEVLTQERASDKPLISQQKETRTVPPATPPNQRCCHLTVHTACFASPHVLINLIS